MKTMKHNKKKSFVYHNDFPFCSHCGKNIYNDKLEAQGVANYREQEDGIPLNVYPCPFGNGWHLTKT